MVEFAAAMLEKVAEAATELAETAGELAEELTEGIEEVGDSVSDDLDLSEELEEGFDDLDLSEDLELSEELQADSGSLSDSSNSIGENNCDINETDTIQEIEPGTKDNPIKIDTINQNLEGQNHPVTDVPFERKTIEIDGVYYEVVAPDFPADFETQLPEDMYQETDSKQFKYCNEQLKKAIEENPELAEMFDEEQLEQIMNGETPDGYTWHHDVTPGHMQLVETETHMKTSHTGGRKIWGGGSENR